MKLKALVMLAAIYVAVAQAQDHAGLGPLEDSQAHWTFQFDVSSGKPLGTQDDARAIYALSWAEATHTLHAKPLGGVVVRWVSPSQAIAKASFADPVIDALLFVFEKRATGWLIVHHYHIPKYPAKT